MPGENGIDQMASPQTLEALLPTDKTIINVIRFPLIMLLVMTKECFHHIIQIYYPIGVHTRLFLSRTNRLSSPHDEVPSSDKSPDVKPVNDVWKTFKQTFQGDRKQSWSRHINKLEVEVFSPNSFVPKQVYHDLRKTL